MYWHIFIQKPKDPSWKGEGEKREKREKNMRIRLLWFSESPPVLTNQYILYWLDHWCEIR